ncbi:MAG: hypothetical protein KGR46_07735 [Verrucomicrobia bacterium]|nr:hypothetical protein [Verrucomicrobiota bacterium]
MAYRFNPFTSQLDFYQEDTQFVSSGGIANLTSGQQDLIREGSIVTTTDGRRWVYSGTGSKNLEASYVELADITPEWSVIAGKPSIPTAAPAAGQIMAGNAVGTAFATVSVSGDATLAATGALTIANNAVTTAKLADNSVTSAKIANGTITNDDMFANAAIGLAKLANLPSGQVVVGNATNVPTATAISGDATLSNTGALTISAGAIGTSKLGGDITTAGKALLDDVDAAAQRSTLGLGNSSTLNVGTTTGTVAAGDDSRLSDARTPTAHTHGNITNDGKIGITSGLPVVTTTSGALTTLPLGTAGQALVVNSGATALEFATPAGGVTSVTGTSPIASSGGTTPAISIADAAADGTTKGAAAFNASDFNSASGVISIDYTNGQSASASNKGFLASTDWTTFNNKIGTGAYTTQTGLTMNTSRLLGRTTASSGAAEEISIGTGLSLTSGTLSVTGGGSTNIWIPASAWIPRTTNGCGVDSRELATNRTNWDELLFDAGTDEFAQALTILPNNYNLGTITARFYWTGSGATDATDDVIWGIQARAFADADDLDIAFGTAQTVTDTLAVINDMQISAATSAVTIGGTPAANRPILFQIYRDADAGGDNYGHDARLLGVEILFN